MESEEQSQVIGRIVGLLDAAGIRYVLCGSLASISYSQPRATYDVDLIIDPTLPQLNALVALMNPEEYYVSPEAARAAYAERSMFNAIDFLTGWKIDLMMLKPGLYDAQEFNRRIEREVLGKRVSVLTPEDSMLSKLNWRKDSRSERQYEDVVKVAAAQWAQLDLAYLRLWAAELGVAGDLEQVLRDADELRPR